MKNVLYRHIRNDHKEEEDQLEFKMKVVGKQNTDELQTGIYRPAVHRRIIEGKQKFILVYPPLVTPGLVGYLLLSLVSTSTSTESLIAWLPEHLEL